MTRCLVAALLLALAISPALTISPVAAKSPELARSRAKLARFPRPLGLRFGIPIASVERLLIARKAQQRLRLVRTIEPTGRRVEHSKLSARLPRGPFRKLKLVFFGGRLVRIKLYGATMPAWVAKRAGKAQRVVGASRYWVDLPRLRGIRCEARRCELFDLRPMIGRGLTRAEVHTQFDRFVARSSKSLRQP
jgi:hypothetical protein